jgi:DNA-binding XRE family transcriptional regulator
MIDQACLKDVTNKTLKKLEKERKSLKTCLKLVEYVRDE